MNPAEKSSHDAPAPDRSEQAAIDASAKWPVLCLVASSVFWLLVGGALQLTAAIQSHSPGFLAGCEWFTFGRVHPAAQNALAYGWGMNAALAISLWLMARLSATTLRHGGWLMVATKFWNIGVLLGVLGILGGWSTSFELLEMPRFVVLLLLVGYALIAAWVVTTFSIRNTENVYASQWYLLAAVFSFPWLFAVAQVMLLKAPVAGTLQALVNAWYVNGLLALCFVPFGLAIAYYFLPKLIGRPVNLYYVAPLGFWWLVAAGGLLAGTRLVNAPVPVWIPTLGVAAALMLVVPITVVALNLAGSLLSAGGKLGRSLTLPFIAVGVVAFLLWGVLAIVTSTRALAADFQFTLGPSGLDWLAIYGAFSIPAFGALYFIVPRLTGREWAAPALIRAHFWAAALGLLLYVGASIVGGFEQGALLAKAEVPFAEVSAALVPWLGARSIALMLLAIGHVAFAVNFAWAVCPYNSGHAADAVLTPPAAMPVPSSAKEAHA